MCHAFGNIPDNVEAKRKLYDKMKKIMQLILPEFDILYYWVSSQLKSFVRVKYLETNQKVPNFTLGSKEKFITSHGFIWFLSHY